MMRKNVSVTILCTIFCLSFSTYFIWIAVSLANSGSSLKTNPNVLDVTTAITAKIRILRKALEDDPDFSKPEFDDSKWEKIQIPDHSILSDKNYEDGAFAYYRIYIPKNELDKLRKFPKELAFAPQYVIFKKSEVYVNGKKVLNINASKETDYMFQIPLEDGVENLIAIKGTIQNGDEGINHRLPLLIGKVSELNGLQLDKYQRGMVFPLIFILSQGSILLLFSLVFFVTQVPKSFETFLIYGLCTIGDSFLVSDELFDVIGLSSRAYLFALMSAGACTSLYMFFCNISHQQILRNRKVIIFSVLFASGMFINFDILYWGNGLTFAHMLKFWNIASSIVLLIALPKVFSGRFVLFSGVLISIALNLFGTIAGDNIGLHIKSVEGLILFFTVAYETFKVFSEEQALLKQKERELIDQEKDVAIGKTAAILAHDVRRPLEQMRLVLEQVVLGKVTPDFIEAAKKDIEFSMMSVSHQVNEIMNITKSRKVQLIPISFYDILSQSINQIFVINVNVQILLEYDFKAFNKIFCDESRLANILTNLISNAVEAIRDIGKRNQGKISFKTKMQDDRFIFSIINDGPTIPGEILSKIFESHASHGKPKGTGLGLVSVLRSLSDSNGSIIARNISEGVEFEISLGGSLSSDNLSSFRFLKNSKDYSSNKTMLDDSRENQPSYRILILSTDSKIINSINMLSGNEKYPFNCTIGETYVEMKSAIKSRSYDLYIFDCNHFESDIYEEVMTDFPYLRGRIVFLNDQTNRTRQEGILRLASPIGAESFFEKFEKSLRSRSRILLADDSRLVRVAWGMFHGVHNILLASSPEEALKIASENPDIGFCVLDYHFDNSQILGQELAEKVRLMLPNAKYFISSSVDAGLSWATQISKSEYEIRKFS